MTKKVIWNPPAELIENSKLTKFIKYCSVKNYDELEIKSQSDPGWLWENVIKFADIKFASTKLEFWKFVSINEAPVKVALVKLALVKFVFSKFAPSKFDSYKFAL